MKELEAIQFVHGQLLQKTEFPDFKTGDTVVVTYKIVEGDKTREQDYRGDVIQIKGHGLTKSFTVRKISHGVGVERIAPLLRVFRVAPAGLHRSGCQTGV